MSDSTLFSIKMRASRAGRHVSGAERICTPSDVPAISAQLTRRALEHPRGVPDDITVSVRAVDDVRYVPALEVRDVDASDVAEAHELIRDILRNAGYALACFDALLAARDMRGALILDAHTGARLDGTGARGARATCMDAAPNLPGFEHDSTAKNPAREALVLASKVAAAPGIVAELCISDAPNYTTGYVATGGVYFRIPHCKTPGSELGGRAFLYAGEPDELPATLEFLQNTPVLVGPR